MKRFNKNSVVSALVVSLAVIISPIASFAAGPAAVTLGTSGDFVILAKSGISTTGNTSITGDIRPVAL